MHATAEILAGKLEKRERKNTRKVIVVKKEIAEGEIRANYGAKEQNDVKNGSARRVLMKWTRVVPLAVAVSLVVIPAANPGTPQADDTSKIVAMENLWNQMQLNHDAAAMGKMLDDEFVLTDYDGAVLDKAQFLDSIKDMSVKLTVELSEGMRLHPHGNTVVITGATREKGTKGSKPFAHIGRFTDTWIKKNGTWLCVASHLGVVSK